MSQEQREAAEASRTPGQGAGIRDGAIDFAGYSTEQLNELRYTLNQTDFPLPGRPTACASGRRS